MPPRDEDDDVEKEEEEGVSDNFAPTTILPRNSMGQLTNFFQQTQKVLVLIFNHFVARPQLQAEENEEEQENAHLGAGWLEELTQGYVQANIPSLFVLIDPNDYPELARKCNVASLPSYSFWWRRRMLNSFCGSNKEKFQHQLTKSIQVREGEHSAESNPPLNLIPGNICDLSVSSKSITGATLQLQGATHDLRFFAALLDANHLPLTPESLIHIDNASNRNRSAQYKEVSGIPQVDLNLNKIDGNVQFISLLVYSSGKPMCDVKDVVLRILDKDTEQVHSLTPVYCSTKADCIQIGALLKTSKGLWQYVVLLNSECVDGSVVPRLTNGKPFRNSREMPSISSWNKIDILDPSSKRSIRRLGGNIGLCDVGKISMFFSWSTSHLIWKGFQSKLTMKYVGKDGLPLVIQKPLKIMKRSKTLEVANECAIVMCKPGQMQYLVEQCDVGQIVFLLEIESTPEKPYSCLDLNRAYVLVATQQSTADAPTMVIGAPNPTDIGPPADCGPIVCSFEVPLSCIADAHVLEFGRLIWEGCEFRFVSGPAHGFTTVDMWANKLSESHW